MTLRASIIPPITWSLLIVFLGPMVTLFFCLPLLFLWDMDVVMTLVMVILFIWFVLMWIYFLTLRLTLENGRLTKSSLLRTTAVMLSEKTLIRHRAEHIVVEGMNLSAAFAGMLSQEATTHIQITVRDAAHQIKVGSALKGIAQLRDQLIEFEANTLLPDALRRLQAGEKVLFEPFEFQQGRVTCQGKHAEIPLRAAPEMKAGVLHFLMDTKRQRIPLKKIWNLLTCLRLLSQGSV
jgi:hypothetical protein